MAYFNIQTIKILAIFCSCLSCIIAMQLVINAAANRGIWANYTGVMGFNTWMPFDFSIGIGLVIVIVCVFGTAGIVLNGYGMVLLYLVTLSIVSLISIVGMMYLILLPWHSNVRKFELMARYLTPKDLADIERNFRCCGIDKFTDYFMIWKIFTDKDYPSQKEVEMLYVTPKEGDTPPGTGSPQWLTKRTTTDFSWFWGKKNLRTVDEARASWLSNLTDYKKDLTSPRPRNTSTITYFSEQQKRHQHHLLRFRYKPDSIYSFIKKYLPVLFKPVWSFIGAVTAARPETHEPDTPNFFVKIWHAIDSFKQAFIPEFIRDICYALLTSALWWTTPAWWPFWKMFRWWWGSGWDDLFWKYVNPSKGLLLPYSCCKLPQLDCRGDPTTTWTDGCLYRLTTQWQIDTNRLIAALGSYLITSAINIGVTTMLLGDIRKKYYY